MAALLWFFDMSDFLVLETTCKENFAAGKHSINSNLSIKILRKTILNFYGFLTISMNAIEIILVKTYLVYG